MSEVKYAMSIIRGKLKNADDHNLHYQRFSIADMEAILGVLSKSESDHAELQQKLDVMVVENAALKIIVECVNSELYGKGFEVAGWHLNGVLEPLDNWFTDNAWGLPETPATDAYLNSVRADAIESVVDALASSGALTVGDSIVEVVKLAESIRSGTHDTADKAG